MDYARFGGTRTFSKAELHDLTLEAGIHNAQGARPALLGGATTTSMGRARYPLTEYSPCWRYSTKHARRAARTGETPVRAAAPSSAPSATSRRQAIPPASPR